METIRLSGNSKVAELAQRYIMKSAKKSTNATMRGSVLPSIKTLVRFMGDSPISAVDFERV